MSCIMMKWNNELMNNELMNGKIIFTKENPLYVGAQISVSTPLLIDEL